MQANDMTYTSKDLSGAQTWLVFILPCKLLQDTFTCYSTKSYIFDLKKSNFKVNTRLTQGRLNWFRKGPLQRNGMAVIPKSIKLFLYKNLQLE